jgi:GT2 family glycosyltransferase
LVLEQGQGNIGFAAGCNLGAHRATGDLLLLLNPDCVLPAGAVRALAAEGETQPRPWLLGPRLLNPDGSEQAGDRRRVLTPWLALVEALGLYRLPGVRRFNLHQDPLPERTLAVPVISGACMLVPRQDYWRVGGMDEGFFLHVEDIDFCVRFGTDGGSVYFCPAVTVPHAKGTSDAPALAVEWHKTRGFFRYFRKHFSHRSAPGVVPLTNGAILLRYVLMALAHLVATPISRRRARQRGERSRCQG